LRFEVAVCAVLMLLGAADDRLRLSPRLRIFIEVLLAFALAKAGYRFGPELPGFVSYALTVFWLVGITNAFNLMDNMDGLASTVAAVSSFAAGMLCWVSNDVSGAVLGFSITAAVTAFLLYNSRPARIFMGDSGSLAIGLALAIVSLRAQEAGLNVGEWSASFMIPISLCAMLILDTSLVTVMRVVHGIPISVGGRDHVSHRLVSAGATESSAVLVIATASAVSAFLPLLSRIVAPLPWLGYVLLDAVGLFAIVAVSLRQDAYRVPASLRRP
jgi:UDP-GlcNAc:undecaprenyl-phosphate GlcNAc-1-phosphate transferase